MSISSISKKYDIAINGVTYLTKLIVKQGFEILRKNTSMLHTNMKKNNLNQKKWNYRRRKRKIKKGKLIFKGGARICGKIESIVQARRDRQQKKK